MSLWSAILKGLEKGGKAAAKAIEKSGKEFAKNPVKSIYKMTGPGSLEEAFKSIGSKDSLKTGELAKGIAQLSGQSPTQSGQMQSYGTGSTRPADTGLLSFLFPSSSASRSVEDIPAPEIQNIASGQAAPKSGMGELGGTIPPQYQPMIQPSLPQTPTIAPPPPIQPRVSQGSFLGGLKEGILGMPQKESNTSSTYYAGKLIPDIIRSKLGVNTSGEEARQQQLMKAYSDKDVTPELQSELQTAVGTAKELGLSEEEKIFMYQKLAAKYPSQSAAIKRIFFPQSQDNNDALMALIAAGGLK